MIAVTGATGWLGRAAVARLLDEGRPFTAFASSARTVALGDGRTFTTRPLTELPATPHDGLVHLAFVTREHAASMGLAAYVAANADITSTVLDAVERHGPAVAYASSGAAAAGRPLAEDPYGALKRLDEHALRGAASSCAVARVFNVAGPHVVKPHGFALSDLVLQALDGRVPEVRAPHPVLRAYTDVDDLARLLLALLDARESASFDTGGEEVELGELAARVAAVTGMAAPVPRQTTGPADRYVGDPADWDALCARHAITPRDLDAQVARTADYLSGDEAAVSAPGTGT